MPTVRIVGYAHVPARAMDAVFLRMARRHPDLHGQFAAPDRLRVDLAVTRDGEMSDGEWTARLDAVRNELEAAAEVPVRWGHTVPATEPCRHCTTLP